MDFVLGQRWVSDTELQMGLGTVMEVEHRTVTLVFLATGETRTYAKATAPLSRVAFVPGDTVQSHEGWSLRVEAVEKQDGLLTYIGSREDGSAARLEEGQLDNFIQLNRPSERLFTGQIDADKWFELRYQTLQQANRLAHSDLHGLVGVRTSLIPHQLFIAHEVAGRYAPRVLLADEVGLGKTIEAGLILHQQLLTERARRVLIVVPESLMYQWLVEMLRRFNLHFSIFDEDRCEAMLEFEPDSNPFHSEQLVLCSLDFLHKNPANYAQALEGDWDLLVVDEAHHLQWSPEHASEEYVLVEQLAARTKGVLLLTATPEQLGKESHFARLRLLDPDRFPDFDTFVAEEASYQPIAQAVEELMSEQGLSEDSHRVLSAMLQEGDNQALLASLRDTDADEASHSAAIDALIRHLLDRHGTGRVLFRNTRAAVKGFPRREVSATALPLPEAYAECLAEYHSENIATPQLLLCPELLYQQSGGETPWTKLDPRVEWLGKAVTTLKAKMLVIAASARTALDLNEALRVRFGIHAAVFHEGMSIVERDRAAAFFADQEYGSQVMICSEIGSEGRNFQFAHHLVLFDLPLNPDLLEQRIGRLDRIGQQEDVRIHVPYLDHSAQAAMFRWYHEGLDAFEHTCPAGHSVFAQVEPGLMEVLHHPADKGDSLAALVKATHELHAKLNAELQQGRDRLLEYNSCQPARAYTLKALAESVDAENTIADYLGAVFDCYGVDMEDHSAECYIVRPSDHMQTDSFPGLHSDGMTITFDRETALSFEDAHYITWEHPMLLGAMDMIQSHELGNTAVTAIKVPGIKPGTLLLECVYVLETVARTELQSSRYLPPTIIRLVLDQHSNELSAKLSHARVNESRIAVDTETAGKVVRSQADLIKDLLQQAEAQAKQKSPEIVAGAHKKTQDMLQPEIERLKALHGLNPNVREEEIRYFETQLAAVTEALNSASPRLDAVRVMVSV